MFNQELKDEFIRSYSTNLEMRKACVSTFNFFEKYETMWGADLCTREANELQEVVEEALGLRAKSGVSRIRLLRSYVKWCINRGVPGACDGMMRVVVDGIEKMKHQTVTSPLHLQMYLNQICEPEYEKTMDNTYRCFYWLAYGGLKEEDIFKIKTGDVDFSNMVVKFEGSEYPIYREALPAFKNCVELNSFLYKHPNYPDKQLYRPRIAGNLLIRGVNAPPNIITMRVEMSRRSRKGIEKHKTEMKLSYLRVWISGLFYRMYEMERAGFPIDFSDAAVQFMKNREYNLGKSQHTIEGYQKKIAKDYLRDYERWKQTFN